MEPEPTAEILPFKARQSTLRGFEQCGRRTFHEIAPDFDGTVGYSEAMADLGTVVHLAAAEMLRTMRREGMAEISTQELIEILYEVYEKSGIVLPAQERYDLTWITLRLADRPWRVDKLLAVEERIDVPIVCQDGVTRILSCQPDALFAGSTDTIVCPDWKSGKGVPKSPRQPQEGVPEDTVRGMAYLSDRGHFQADAYGLAALHRYPQAQRFVFRELHLRSGQIREAIMGREEFEHVERLIGIHLMKLERGLAEGEDSEVFKPRPGPWCQRQCPVNASCPVPKDQRGRGAIADEADADDVAARFVMVDGLRGHLRDLLKTNWAETGRPARVGDGTQITFDGGKGGAYNLSSVEDYEAARAEAVGF